MRTHDYDPEWDYELDNSRTELSHWVPKVAKEIREVVLPQLGLSHVFEDFEYHYVKNTGVLGKYVDGTRSHPVIVLDRKALEGSVRKYGVSYETAVRTTILHELGHAIQDANDLPYNEEQAEDFARVYEQDGIVWKFWEENEAAA